ncbi:PCSK6 isoform 1, partial [Pan troglodytes]
GLPHKVCRRCGENCLSCAGSSRNCSRCKTGFTQLGTSCITNHTCSNGDIWQRLETFWVVTTGRMYSHPVGGGQEYC